MKELLVIVLQLGLAHLIIITLEQVDAHFILPFEMIVSLAALVLLLLIIIILILSWLFSSFLQEFHFLVIIMMQKLAKTIITITFREN